MSSTGYKTRLTSIVQDGYDEPSKRKNIVSIKKCETRLTSNVEEDRDEPKLKICKLKKIQLGNILL